MEHIDFETITVIFIGIGLAATAGFRVFIPFLIGSIAMKAGMISPAAGFEWLGSTPALILFTTASILEVVAYYFPWLDNLLDTIATPSAVIAGTLLSASFIDDSSQLFRWGVGIVAGGGAAGIVQAATVMVRGGSTATTGGVANPVVSTGELGASVIGSVLAIFFPVLAIILILIFISLLWKFRPKFLKSKSSEV